MTDQIPSDAGDRIDRICDQYETDWKAGHQPAIEAFLTEIEADFRSALLRELVALDAELRSRSGVPVTAEEYRRRFPELPVEAVDNLYRTIPAASASDHSVAPPFASVPLSGSVDEGNSRLTLTVTEGPLRGRVLSFSSHSVFIFGRSKNAHLQIADKYFSRVHFMIESNLPHCRLTDMNSHNKTFVNGQCVQTAALRDGDRIRAGHTTLLVSITGAEAPAEVAPDALTLDLPPGECPAVFTNRTAPPPIAAITSAPPSLPRLPGYHLERELGRGGMGAVYLATHEQSGTQVAVKVIIPDVTPSRKQIQLFLREARILSKLKHNNIVAFREMDEADGQLYFSMDYIVGSDAARLLRQCGPLPVRMAVRIVCQVLSALHYAHGEGFVHRDIKPANLLISDEAEGRKRVRVADFGLSRVYQQSQLSGLTVDGEVGGTIAFMPPEHITHFRQVKPPADQYASAATLYNLLTGKHLFDFENSKVPPIALILEQKPESLLKRRPDLPPELAVVLDKALAKDPQNRFEDVRKFLTALKPFAE